MVVILDEVLHGSTQLVWAGIDQQVHAHPQGFMEALDFAIGLGMMWGTVDVPNGQHAEIFFEGPRQVARSVVYFFIDARV